MSDRGNANDSGVTGPSRADRGMWAYAALLGLHRIAVDPAQLRHALGHQEEVSAADLLRLAKSQEGVRAREVTSSWEKLARTPLPALAQERVVAVRVAVLVDQAVTAVQTVSMPSARATTCRLISVRCWNSW